MSSVKIIHNCSDFVVAVKKAGVHSAPLQADDTSSALSLVAKDFPQIMNVRGKKEIERGLIHRIDYDTAGLLLFACNQDFYHHIINCQEAGLFTKTYFACCNYIPQCPDILGGFPLSPICTERITSDATFFVSSAFRPFGLGRKEVRPVTEDSGKYSRKKVSSKKNTNKQSSLEKRGEKLQTEFSAYSTNINIEKIQDEKVFLQASISKGYRHQVRCHLAWCSLPIVGDPIYYPSVTTLEKAGDTCSKTLPTQMQFFATGLSFPTSASSLEKYLSNREEFLSSIQYHAFLISPEEVLNF